MTDPPTDPGRQVPPDLRVLVVDDDEIDVQAIKRSVRRAGLPFGLYSVSNGPEALDVLRRESVLSDEPFLVLLDLTLRADDGFDFLGELRADDELHEQIVFVLTTASPAGARTGARFVAGYLVKAELAPGYEPLVELIRDDAATVRSCDDASDPTSNEPRRS